MPVTLNIIESTASLGQEIVEVVLASASEPGPAGPGVPTGGTTGQALVKSSNADFDTEWSTGAGAPTDADYLVGTASGTLSAEIVVGTSPGGELGGTWASPTVDATHSGSSHASVQAAAEATAAAALSAHEADTTGIHGIANTANLETTAGAQAKVDAHVNDTSDAHDASAISFSPAGTIAATDVQAAIEEVASEAGGGGAPTDVDYLVGTASGSLSAEIVVGTSPGGELGGTWASPTVDASHSGSTHAAVQAAAEATAAAALSAHLTDTSDAHDASAISVVSTTLSGTGTDVQAVFEEIDNLLDDHSARHENGGADEISIAGLDGTPTELTNHLNDATDAHDASAISSVAAGNLSSTDVQAALNELDSEKTTAAAALTAAQTEIADQKRVAVIAASDPNGDAITTGDGKAYFPIPNILNGHNLVDADAVVTTVSSSGTPTFQIHNLTQAADMLSTRITIDANENTSYTAAAPPVIDTGNDDVATGDILRFDCDVAGTGTKGVFVILTFEAP